MSTPTPEQKISSEINSLQSKLRQLQNGARLSRTFDTLEDVQTKINSLSMRIRKLRESGYAFEKEMELQAEDFSRQWTALNPSLISTAKQQASALQAALQPLEAQMLRLVPLKSNPAAARPVLDTLSAGVKTLENNIAAAERQINGMYNSLNGQVSTLTWHLEKIEWMLNQLAEAKFTLRPTESGIMAVKAVWCQSGNKETKDDPEGILYLTDQRLIFEQKQEVAAKKVLFITTAKEKVQVVKWETPVTAVAEVTPSKQGMLKQEDRLDLRFGSGAPLPSAHLHIWQSGNEWVKLINRAKSGDFDGTRAIEIDQAVVEKVKSAPSQCPSCGANLTQTVQRGMDSIQCEYCGYTIRL